MIRDTSHTDPSRRRAEGPAVPLPAPETGAESSTSGSDRPAVNRTAGKKGYFRNWKRLASDTWSLAGLQSRLFQLDSAAWVNRTRMAVVAAIVGGLLAVSAMPVLLVAAAIGMNSAGLHLGWSMLIAGGTAAVAGAVMLYIALSKMKQSFNSFQRSREELASNLTWLKDQFSGN